MRGVVVDATVLLHATTRAATTRGRVPALKPGQPRIMGILNVTPDSFSDGGRWLRPRDALRHAQRMAADGADLIDVGGESTRPGARAVPLEEELARVIPVIRLLARRVSVPLSIDTSKAEVARQALEAGASLVNDVTALAGDPAMAAVVSRAGAPVILMHMRGSPRTMQRHPRYHNVIDEVKQALRGSITRAQHAGIPPRRILLDPGLGFGKTATHNLLLLRHLDELATLGYPLVVGPSRKSFIGRLTGAAIHERLPGSLASIAQAAQGGASIVRVHDVKPARQFLTVWRAIARCG